MVHTSTSFPTAPRRPTWRRSLLVRWPLAVAGVLLMVASLVAEERLLRRDLAIGALLLPGIALTMIWLRGVMRFRVLLTSGEITPRITTGERRTFFDGDGREHAVRDREREGRSVAVVFDPHEPRIHRLVTPDDFVNEAAG